MSCLCKYLTPERAAKAGVDIRGKVCVACAVAAREILPSLARKQQALNELYPHRPYQPGRPCFCDECVRRRTSSTPRISTGISA